MAKVEKLSPFRIMSSYGYEALGTGHNMYALIEIDITEIRQKLRLLRKQGKIISLYGFLLSAIAKTIHENKEFNLIRSGRKLYYFDEVDMDTSIEMKLQGASVPRKFLLRDAQKKTAREITAEIEEAKRKGKEGSFAGEDDKWALSFMKLATRLPRWLLKSMIRMYARNPYFVKKHFGTTYVTSVGGFTDVSGFLIPFIAGKNRPVSIVIGGISRKAGSSNVHFSMREMLSITLCFNHDLVDGAPAARFVNRLKNRMESSLNSETDFT